MNKLTQEEALKFHEFLSDIMVSNHKWEILNLLDRIIGHCPNEKKEEKDTVHGKLNKGGPGEGQS